ncbi:acidic phospholipase A2-like [Branchiostoma floridae x Branchiostoma japonicum]
MFVLNRTTAVIALTLSLIAILASMAEGHKKHKDKKMSRNAYHLGRLLYCTTRRNPLDYNGYGCWCGFGGGGEPMDDVDRCCKAHDECYVDVEKSCGSLFVYIGSYGYRCKRREITCTSNSSWFWSQNSTNKCKTALCNCDKVFAECCARYPYNNENYGKCNSK